MIGLARGQRGEDRQPERAADLLGGIEERGDEPGAVGRDTCVRRGGDASGTGLRSYHYRLLAALEEWGPVSQADLARSTAVDRSDVVTVLGELEQLGLIERTVDPNNRRRNIVSITRAGSDQLGALDPVIDEVQQRVLAPLSQNERGQLTKLLRKLVDAG